MHAVKIAKPSEINDRHDTAVYRSSWRYDPGKNEYVGAILDVQDLSDRRLITIGVEHSQQEIIRWTEQTLANYAKDLPEALDAYDRGKH